MPYLSPIFTRMLAAFLAIFLSTAGATATPFYPLSLELKGEGHPIVVLIHGNGSNASAWNNIEPQIRSMGVQTVVYDRVILDPHPMWEGGYAVEHEAKDLITALSDLADNAPIILVAHSYGGYIASLLVEELENVQGIVFVDAGIPQDMSAELVDFVLAEYTPRFEALEKAAPELAKTVIPVIKAYPATAQRMGSVTIPQHLPVIDIVAETSWVKDAKVVAQMRKAHADFTAASPNRISVFAKGSGHNVMQDKPEYVIEAIKRIVEQVRGK
ncbi:alpha/beta fold hydrolase [Pseudovibrio denitrificans]|uniref:alpha/beta fold hydrolase n=1 Tax=Pseudovibrio denitrificans TaxID=258256 RepID=UPI001ABF53AF|nr:alpha/beta hydrolase [Pseudovibrio denitrificans]